jgi:hypothetical protein
MVKSVLDDSFKTDPESFVKKLEVHWIGAPQFYADTLFAPERTSRFGPSEWGPRYDGLGCDNWIREYEFGHVMNLSKDCSLLFVSPNDFFDFTHCLSIDFPFDTASKQEFADKVNKVYSTIGTLSQGAYLRDKPIQQQLDDFERTIHSLKEEESELLVKKQKAKRGKLKKIDADLESIRGQLTWRTKNREEWEAMVPTEYHKNLYEALRINRIHFTNDRNCVCHRNSFFIPSSNKEMIDDPFVWITTSEFVSRFEQCPIAMDKSNSRIYAYLFKYNPASKRVEVVYNKEKVEDKQIPRHKVDVSVAGIGPGLLDTHFRQEGLEFDYMDTLRLEGFREFVDLSFAAVTSPTGDFTSKGKVRILPPLYVLSGAVDKKLEFAKCYRVEDVKNLYCLGRAIVDAVPSLIKQA